jgi:hypothetical protein
MLNIIFVSFIPDTDPQLYVDEIPLCGKGRTHEVWCGQKSVAHMEIFDAMTTLTLKL